MHRLRTFRKGKEEDDPATPSSSSTHTTHSHKPFKWGKSQSPPPKQPELDLQHVLPPTDDFRTSLLMPNLAQRFSILQMEQAAAAAAAAAAASNGNGRVGNGGNGTSANVAGTNHNVGLGETPAFLPLGDIAETASVATQDQTRRLTAKSDESGGSGSGSAEQDGGSIMNRSRGGEGNVLFGGRQKVYRLPTAARAGSSSEEDLGGRSASPMRVGVARVVYENDLSDSAFPKPRHEHDGANGAGLQMDGAADYDKNRYTSSSAGSVPNTVARSSTAATSVTSNGNSVSIHASASTTSLPAAPVASMVANKPRRPLYEQALDQQLQDHQTSSAGRLERLASIRKLGTSSDQMSGYPVNGNGNYSSPQLSQVPGQRISPTSPTSHHNNQWAGKKRPDSPLSPPEEEAPEKYHVERQKPAQTVLPNLGTFNFGLEPVPSRTPISPPVSASAVEFPAQGRFNQGAHHHARQRSLESVASPPPERQDSPPLDGTNGPRLGRNSQDTVDSQTLLSMQSSSTDSSYDEGELESDYEDRPISRSSIGRPVAPLGGVQPGISVTSSPVSEPPSPVSPESPAREFTPQYRMPRDVAPLRNPIISPRLSDVTFTTDDDSPTLPPPQGLGLLVQQHLRSDSGHSSVYATSTYTRSSRYMPTSKQSSEQGVGKASSGNGTVRPSGASGSSGGNLWEFDDWEGGGYAGGDNGRSSPSTISDLQGFMPPPPSIPQRAPGRVPAMPDMKANGDRREEEDWQRERELAASRVGGLERNRAEEEEQDKDWEQQLAFRRQIIQQNLRNQEKVNSQHEMPFPPPDFRGQPGSNGPGGFNILKSKSSNGFLAKNDAMSKGIRTMGMEPPLGPPPMRPDGRGRMVYDDERMYRGPHGMPPPHHHHHPMHQPPPLHLRQFQGQQALGAGQPYNRHPPPPHGDRPPIGLPHPLHSPKHTPRMRQRQSQEQMGPPNGPPPRGMPMGWKDDNWGMPRSAPGTQPGTPTTPRDARMVRKQPSMPGMGGHRDDMSRPPMMGPMMGPMQGPHYRPREEDRRHPPPQHHQPRPQYDNGPGFDHVEASPPPPPSSHSSQQDYRRPRNNSNNDMQAPKVRSRKGTLDGSTLPPINTNLAVAPPHPQPPPSAATPYSAAPADKSPAYPQRTPIVGPSGPAPSIVSSAMANIQNSNAGFAPAKKRVINKSQIGEPKLLSATSNIPTKALPPQDPTPPLSASSASSSGGPRRRRMTTTQTIFSGFGKKDEAPAVPSSSLQPTSSRHRSDDEIERSSFTDEPPPPKKNRGGKLRKSTSDGGALAARSRQQARGPTVPKIQKGVVGQKMDAPEGMI